MVAPSSLLEQTRRRLLYQQRANILGFFVPLMVTVGVFCYILFSAFSLPSFLVLIPLSLVGAWLTLALLQARQAGKQETVAAFLDEKTNGQERFLTLATLAQHQVDLPLFTLLQHQAAGKAASFVPARDTPFRLDRRVPVAVLVAALSILMLFLSPPTPVRSLLAPQPTTHPVLTNLENIARELMAQDATSQERATGAQLLALVEELKNPVLSLRQKQRLIEEAQRRMNLPLPQLLPLDLELFASENKQGEGAGNHSDQPQPESEPLAKANQQLEQLKKTLSAAAGNEPQAGPQKNGEDKEETKPREAGGGIKFNLPPPQSEDKQEHVGQEPSGQQQQSAQEQAPNDQAAGTDPNKPGERQDHEKSEEQKGPHQSPQSDAQQEQGSGSSLGGAPGKRFRQAGEQSGGFLTKDARFVKVRVPIGQEIPGDDKRTENHGRAVPKTPYSNAPLKEGLPDQPQPRQPIPLEYRAILQ